MSPLFSRTSDRDFASFGLTALLLSGLVACGGGGATATGPDGGGGSGGAGGSGGSAGATATGGATGGAVGGDPNAIVGAFVIGVHEALNGNMPYADVAGVVRAGPKLIAAPYVVKTRDGDCALETPQIPFCSTACGSTATCVADDVCKTDPAIIEVGTPTLTGVTTTSGPTTLELSFIGGMGYGAAGLAYPPFAEGDDVGVTTTGGAYAPLSIHAKGIAPLVVPPGTIPLEKNKPIALTWTAAGASATSSIHVHIEISHHGGPSKGQIECDVADTGSLTISAPLVTQLLNLGFAGFPSIDIVRSSTGSQTIAPGRVQLVLSDDVMRILQIPGVDYCVDDVDCPTGHTCNKDKDLCN